MHTKTDPGPVYNLKQPPFLSELRGHPLYLAV